MREIALLVITMAFIGACQSNPGKNSDSVNPIAADKDNAGLKLPAGFSALVYADNIGHARHLAINTNGDV